MSPRYMLPAYPLAAVMAGALVARLSGPRRAWMTTGLVAVMLFHVAGWVDAAVAPVPPDEERGTRLVQWLDDRGIRACYSASPLYHLVFAGGEKVVISPLQKDRYPAYDQVIEAEERVCYVFREDQKDKRQHKGMLDLLAAKGVHYQQAEVGAYHVLYDLEPRRALKNADVDAVRTAPPPAAGGSGEAARRTAGQAAEDDDDSETE